MRKCYQKCQAKKRRISPTDDNTTISTTGCTRIWTQYLLARYFITLSSAAPVHLATESVEFSTEIEHEAHWSFNVDVCFVEPEHTPKWYDTGSRISGNHWVCLLQAIVLCFRLHFTKDSTTINTAAATVRQLISVVFERVAAEDAVPSQG